LQETRIEKIETQFSRKSLKQSSALACWYNVHILEIMIKPPLFLSKAKVIAAGGHGFVES
jgi:hypothetical protein